MGFGEVEEVVLVVDEESAYGLHARVWREMGEGDELGLHPKREEAKRMVKDFTVGFRV